MRLFCCNNKTCRCQYLFEDIDKLLNLCDQILSLHEGDEESAPTRPEILGFTPGVMRRLSQAVKDRIKEIQK